MIVGIRHAQVHNPNGLVYGRLPGFGLSEEGRAAARDLSAALAQAPVRAVYSSPLDRARETAATLAEPHGVTVQQDQRLSEWSFWEHWQGMEWRRIRERDPQLLEAYGKDPSTAMPQASLEMAGREVMGWAEGAESGDPGALVLGVTHEAPLIAAMLLGQGRNMAEYHSHNLAHLACVRLLPGPPELVDLPAWAASC